jgi:hypothetical protein
MASTYNPTIPNNATWGISVTILQPPVAPATVGLPFDLTTYTGKSEIRSHDGNTVLATCTVTITNAALGQLRCFLSLAQAALLHPTSAVVSPKTALPVWDVIIGNSDQSKVFRIVEGVVTVQNGVTHW